MTARWRVSDEKGCYAPRDPTPVLLAMGENLASIQVYNIRAPQCELLPFGTEFESDAIVGPHLEPLNDEAKEKIAAYWFKNPGATLDPTRKMPLGQDPMGGRSIEQLVTSLLDGMERDAIRRATAESPQVDAETLALLASIQATPGGLAALKALAERPVKGSK